MKSKNKLVPRLLGITKESVMRVDERTKDVVQEWPLTTVKRWAASPKSFTLVRQRCWFVALTLPLLFVIEPTGLHQYCSFVSAPESMSNVDLILQIC